MKNTQQKIFFNLTSEELAIAVLFSLLALWFMGCDGTTEMAPEATSDAGASPDTQIPTSDTKIPSSDTLPSIGTVSCEIPASTFPSENTPYFVRVTNDAKAACRSFIASNPTIPNTWPKENSPSTATSFSTSGVDCNDVAHDFQGTTGMPWCLGLIGTTALSACAGTPDGKVTCQVSGIAPTGKRASSDPARRTLVKTVAACDMAGKFVGWMCTTS